MSFSELHNAQRTQNTARYAEERKNAQSVTPGGKKFPRRNLKLMDKSPYLPV